MRATEMELAMAKDNKPMPTALAGAIREFTGNEDQIEELNSLKEEKADLLDQVRVW